MEVYIDESGIHKFSGYSVVCFVYVQTDGVKEVEKALIKVENLLGIRKFRWSDFGSKRGWVVRESFIRHIIPLPFLFNIIYFQNPIAFHSAFEHVLHSVIQHDRIRKIIIDGKKSRTYSRRIKNVLRKHNISVKKVVMANDGGTPGLRLADALAGLYRSHMEKPTSKTNDLISLITRNNKKPSIMDGQIAR